MNKIPVVLLAAAASFSSTHLQAQTINFPEPGNRVKVEPGKAGEPKVEENTAITGWRIGSFNSLSISAPGNMKAGGADWAKLPVDVRSWSGENPDVRVEIVRAASSDFEAVKAAALARLNDTAGTARHTSFTLDTYPSTRIEVGGKTAVISKHGMFTWGVVVLPTSSTNASSAAKTVIDSLWLERTEQPEWKDRAMGEGFQAELPMDLAPAVSSASDVRSYRARWNDMHVGTLVLDGNFVFDGTIDKQIEAYKKLAQGEAKVQRYTRDWSYEIKERGAVAQIDFKQKEEPQRVYLMATVAGTRIIISSIWIHPNNPAHLAAAKRILSTLRLGYTEFDNWKTVTLQQDGLSFESPATFNAPKVDGVLRSYVASDQRNLVFSLETSKALPPISKETSDLGNAARDIFLTQFLEGANMKLQKTTVLPTAVGAFPARRLRFEAKAGKKWVYGDALVFANTSRIWMPIYLTDTASNDVMPHLASTLKIDAKPLAGWKSSVAGTGDLRMLLPEDAKPTTEKDKWKLEVERDGIKLHIEEERKDIGDEIYISFDGLTEGEKADNPMVNDWEALNAVKSRVGWFNAPPEFHWASTNVGNARGIAAWSKGEGIYSVRDIVALRDGSRRWLLEVQWNPSDAKSCATRDAVWSSMRCEIPKAVASDNDSLGFGAWWF